MVVKGAVQFTAKFQVIARGHVAQGISSHRVDNSVSGSPKKIKFIVKDITSKLKFKKTDNFLDVGCGDSKILKYIKQKVKSATEIDHYIIIKKLKKKINNEKKFI